MVILKMGLFPRIPAPEMESWALYRHPWQAELRGTVKYKTLRGGETLREPFLSQSWSRFVGLMKITCTSLRRLGRSQNAI
ncbi:hypothetical protein GGR57DRAFT_453934, partial [Xylariaceae sp. FL1272]